MQLFDQVLLDETSKMKLLLDGRFVASPRCARIGIQEYRGFEVNRPEMQTVRVFRSEDQVFNETTLKTFAHLPVTLNHPDDLVDGQSYRSVVRGHTDSEVVRDGNFVRVSMMLMDTEAIEKVLSGTRELSMGYEANLVWEPGT